jgi:hypothetical protein
MPKRWVEKIGFSPCSLLAQSNILGCYYKKINNPFNPCHPLIRLIRDSHVGLRYAPPNLVQLAY